MARNRTNTVSITGTETGFTLGDLRWLVAEAVNGDSGTDEHKLESRIDAKVNAETELQAACGARLRDAIDAGVKAVPVELGVGDGEGIVGGERDSQRVSRAHCRRCGSDQRCDGQTTEEFHR